MRFILSIPALAMATHMPAWYREKLEKADRSDNYQSCDSNLCEQPSAKFTKMLPMQAGVQWGQHGGYCGAWSVQRAALAKGAYISQQQVRDHADFGGGHDNEVLNTNIDSAFEKLHIKHENFQFNVLPSPQTADYLKFMKKQLIAGNPVIWMIMFDGDTSPDDGYTMDNVTNGIYGHIEPVVGILSNHELSDETVYSDDVFAYFDDASKSTYYVKSTEVSGQCKFSGTHCRASCPNSDQCLWDQHGYVYAIQDFNWFEEGVPSSLSISPFASEPYTRGGAPAIDITGTLTVTKLQTGSKYDIYRWGSSTEAFIKTDAYKIHTFVAMSDTFVFEDPKKFLSSSATYYRCMPASAAVQV